MAWWLAMWLEGGRYILLLCICMGGSQVSTFGGGTRTRRVHEIDYAPIIRQLCEGIIFISIQFDGRQFITLY